LPWLKQAALAGNPAWETHGVFDEQDPTGELVDRLWQHLKDPDPSITIDLIDQLVLRLEQEDDEAMAAWIGDCLLLAALQVAMVSRGSARQGCAWLLELQVATIEERVKHELRSHLWFSRLRWPATAQPSDRLRVTRGSWKNRARDSRRRVVHAIEIYDLLIRRFGPEPDARFRRLAVSARLNRAVMLVALGCYRAAVPELRGWFATDEDSISAVLQAARPGAGGRYSRSDCAAAFLANALPIGGRSDSQATLMRIEEILLAGLSDRKAKSMRRELRLMAGPRPHTPTL
jgi:hypothetical protein